MNHHAMHNNGTRPLAFPLAGRAAARQFKPGPNRKRHTGLLLVVLVLIAFALGLEVAKFSFDLDHRAPATPAPTPRVQFHTDPELPVRPIPVSNLWA